MKKLILYFSVSILLFSCADKGSIVIKGKLENPKGEYIYLQELTVKGDGKIDSLLLPKSGSFKFKRAVQYPSFYNLRVGKINKAVILLAMPGDRIKINGIADSLFYTYSVTGSKESEHVKALSQRLDKTIHSIDSLNKVLHQFKDNPNIENIRNILLMNYTKVVEDQRQFTISFIEKNPKSLANLLAVYQKINSNSFVLDKEEDVKYMQRVDSALYKAYKGTPIVEQLHANLDLVKQQANMLKLQQMLSIMGAKAPEIKLPSYKGDTVKLSSIKNKVVILYFWASWNADSRKEQKALVPVYFKYKTKGLEIFAVSLDKSKEDWVNAIKTDGAWWIQASDLKYWDSPVVKQYNFEKLPTVFLIDKDGSIISRDIKGEALNNKLAEIFSEKSTNTASK